MNCVLFSFKNLLLQCPFEQMSKDLINNNSTITLERLPRYIYRIATSNTQFLNDEDEYICDIKDGTFGEYGIYELYVNSKSCRIEEIKEPVSIYFRK